MIGMRSVGIKLLRNKLSEYIRLASQGETILITDADRVVAEITQPQEGRADEVPDAVLADAVRNGWITPPLIGNRSCPGSLWHDWMKSLPTSQRPAVNDDTSNGFRRRTSSLLVRWPVRKPPCNESAANVRRGCGLTSRSSGRRAVRRPGAEARLKPLFPPETNGVRPLADRARRLLR